MSSDNPSINDKLSNNIRVGAKQVSCILSVCSSHILYSQQLSSWRVFEVFTFKPTNSEIVQHPTLIENLRADPSKWIMSSCSSWATYTTI